MLIALVGPRGSGKRTVRDYLVSRHAFAALDLGPSHATPDELLSHATTHWRERFVTLSVDAGSLDSFSKRPFFLLVAVDAPLLVRFSRSAGAGAGELGAFVAEDDALFYRGGRLSGLMARADVTVTNDHGDLASLWGYLDTLDLASADRLRPGWDVYFLSLCALASRRSNCMKRRVGAVLVRNQRVLSTGYNGTPRGLRNCADGGCPRCNASAACGTALDECLCLHAEENALLEAGRAEGTVLYCNTCPCRRCSVKIVQTGVKEVVYQHEYTRDEASARIFHEAGVVFRRVVPIDLPRVLA